MLSIMRERDLGDENDYDHHALTSSPTAEDLEDREEEYDEDELEEYEDFNDDLPMDEAED